MGGGRWEVGDGNSRIGITGPTRYTRTVEIRRRCVCGGADSAGFTCRGMADAVHVVQCVVEGCKKDAAYNPLIDGIKEHLCSRHRDVWRKSAGQIKHACACDPVKWKAYRAAQAAVQAAARQPPRPGGAADPSPAPTPSPQPRPPPPTSHLPTPPQLADGHQLVGRRVAVWWAGDSRFYKGVVDEFNATNGTHHVRYDDNDDDWYMLSKEQVQWLACAEPDPPAQAPEVVGPAPAPSGTGGSLSEVVANWQAQQQAAQATAQAEVNPCPSPPNLPPPTSQPPTSHLQPAYPPSPLQITSLKAKLQEAGSKVRARVRVRSRVRVRISSPLPPPTPPTSHLPPPNLSNSHLPTSHLPTCPPPTSQPRNSQPPNS